MTHLYILLSSAVLQALPDIRACQHAAQHIAEEVARLEQRIKFKKTDLKQGQEELTALQVGKAAGVTAARLLQGAMTAGQDSEGVGRLKRVRACVCICV